MKTYNDLFADNGIITALKKVDADKYNEIFGDEYDNDLLDDYICFCNGDYLCTEKTQNIIEKDKTNDKVAKMIWLGFFAKWKATLKTLAVDFDISYSDTDITERVKDTTSNVDETSTDNNKIYAYNSETASNDTMSDNVRNTDGKGNETEKITHTTNGYDYGVSLYDIVNQYRNNQTENIFCDVVKNDIIGFLCYNIY